jgi:hypothetical protein
LKHDYENLLALCPNCHRRADNKEIDRKSLRLYKANLRFAHDKYSQIELDVLFELYKNPPGHSIHWLPAVLMLLKRVIESEYLRVYTPANVSVILAGMRSNPDYLFLTDKGRAFVDGFGLHEL